MKTWCKLRSGFLGLLLSLLVWGAIIQGAQGAPLSLVQTPLFITGTVLPNVLVIYDNSESMDGTMAGMVIAGDSADVNGNPLTRGNIGRQVMRNVITTFRSSFNWGLMSYGMTSNPPGLYSTYAYYLGSDTGMIFTDDCSGTPLVSPSNGNHRCIANPQPFTGGHYVTYDKSGDDPDVNDVLYAGGGMGSFWGLSPGNGTDYDIYSIHNTAAGNSWNKNSAFSGGQGRWSFTPTDAGYLPANPPITRQLYLPRAWGYYSNITGGGNLNEPVQKDSNTHYNYLMTLLSPETSSPSSGEIKNGAVFTPLTGTLTDAKTYFSSSFANQPSPIAYDCQKNFVIAVTDGLPTGKTDGNLYSDADRQNTSDPTTGTWTFGQAAQDTINAVSALRTTVKGAKTYDIQTYAVGLGDTVANPGAIAVLNQMAQAGGTDSAFLASSQASFQAAMQNITNDITAKIGSGSSVSLNTGSWSTNSVVYQARFHSGDWSGQVLAYPINQDGSLGTALWDAGQKINTQDYATGRSIITYKPSTNQGIPFHWPANPASPSGSELDLAQATALNTNISNVNDGQGSARVDYLRGSSVKEGTGNNNYRVRTISKLGDIVYSSPYFVGAPAFNYPDTLETVPYSSFLSTYHNRESMVYAGANDGMLHGFDAASGLEKIAYVPSKVYPYLSWLTSPTYGHHFYVDGSPTVGDAFYGGAWHTILVGGLRAGGQGFFALDVTDPSSFSENNAAHIVRWEFNDSQDTDPDSTMQYALGYSYSQPFIVKMANGHWAVVFGNGYNNTEADGHASTSGYAVLYILDIETGSVIKKISTQTGSVATPNGLTTPTAVDVNGDGVVEYIYAGDLLGNVWKFDVSSSDVTQWKVASFSSGTNPHPLPLFTAADASGNAQPIMDKLEVGRNDPRFGGYLVYFGTGKYLELADNSTTNTQTFYAIWDNGTPVLGRNQLQLQTTTTVVTVNGADYRITSNTPTNYATTHGWYLDLPTAGERQVTDPILSNGKIIFTTLIPDTTPCSSGGTGWLMELDAVSGSRLSYVSLDVDNNGLSGNVPPSGLRLQAIPTTPGILADTSGSSSSGLENKYISLSDGSIKKVLEKSGRSSGRVSWKQLH